MRTKKDESGINRFHSIGLLDEDGNPYVPKKRNLPKK